MSYKEAVSSVEFTVSIPVGVIVEAREYVRVEANVLPVAALMHLLTTHLGQGKRPV